MFPLSHIGFTTAAVKMMERGLRLRQIDYRMVIVSSLLPDLLDKPLAKLLKTSLMYESRAVGHSLLFLGIIGVFVAMQWVFNRNVRFLPVFLGTMVHDVFDVMWIHPSIFFWPIKGWRFPELLDEAWLGTFQIGWYKIAQRDLFDNISVLILLYFFMKVALGEKILEFIRKGKL